MGAEDDVTVSTVQVSSDGATGVRPAAQGHTNAELHDGADGVVVNNGDEEASPTFKDRLRMKRKRWGQFYKTKEFWIVLLLGQLLSLCLTSTNTFSELLVIDGVSIPAFQNLFNYALLAVAFGSFTIYRYGIKKWANVLFKDSWRYIPFAFVDVEGNYFFVLAYRYTTILSVTLIDFWAIAVVVIVSLIFLKVRYHITQYIGILICIGGLGILLGSDHITGYNQFPASNALKGDLFALLGATLYGLSNTIQEYMVSKRPMYEVLGMIGFWGTIINGVQAAIFDRVSFQSSTWHSVDGGYFSGYALTLALFYSVTPIVMRMASAAFFNISLLTSDFWSVIVGVQRFHLHVHWMYPIAFVCIVLGLLVYFLTESVLGEAKKPWLGQMQEKGVDGVGTARRKIAQSGGTVVDAIGEV